MTNILHPVVQAIRNGLERAANPDNADPMQSYMKSDMPYRGVKSPQQNEIFRSAVKGWSPSNINEYIQVITDLWDANYREERYGAILAKRYKKFQLLSALPTYRMMIETGAWWDYVDAIASHLIGALLKDNPAQMKQILQDWSVDRDVWIRRSAILAQLRFKSDTDSELLFDFCRKCMHEEVFWIRKAIGWALREYSKSNKELVKEFVDQHRDGMSKLTLKEASKYL